MGELVDLFLNLAQQGGIQASKDDMTFVKGEAQTAAQRTIDSVVIPLEKRLDKLSLICQAMWSLLQEKTNLTEADLLKRVTEMDAVDGNIDGKMTKPPVQCSQCGSMVCRKFNRCLFCGAEYTDGSSFDMV